MDERERGREESWRNFFLGRTHKTIREGEDKEREENEEDEGFLFT